MKTKEIWLFVGLGIIAALIVIRFAGGKPAAEKDLRSVSSGSISEEPRSETDSDSDGSTLLANSSRQTKSSKENTKNSGVEFRSGHQEDQNVGQPKTGLRTGSSADRQKKIRSIMKSAGNRGLSDEQVAMVIDNAKSEVLGIRATAVTALGQSKSPAAIEPLIHALMDTNLKVRQRAKVSLKNLLGVEMAYDPASSKAARRRAADRIMENVPSFRTALTAEHGGVR